MVHSLPDWSTEAIAGLIGAIVAALPAALQDGAGVSTPSMTLGRDEKEQCLPDGRDGCDAGLAAGEQAGTHCSTAGRTAGRDAMPQLVSDWR